MNPNTTQANKSMEETVEESTIRGQSDRRTATINADRSGVPIGIAIWLNADELMNLGVDPKANDTVDVHVSNGELKLIPDQAESPD